jgi:hypothetical protein
MDSSLLVQLVNFGKNYHMEGPNLFTSQLEIDDLIEKFIQATLPKVNWTHEAHLTVAIWHLQQYDFYHAFCLVKSRIIFYNTSVGGTNDSANGYHESITMFWMKVAHFYVSNNRTKPMLTMCNDFLKSPLASRDLPFYFYDKEKLMSPKYRAIYMEPKKVEFDYGTLGKILRQELTW